MAQISCVVIFVDRPQFTFTEVSAAVQKNFKEFENMDPKQLVLNPNQSIDNVPDDVPVCIFHADGSEILLAKNRFTFIERVGDKELRECYSEKVKEMLDSITEVFMSVTRFEDLKYRLGIVIEGSFSTKEVALRSLQKVIGDNSDLCHDEIEVSVNDSKSVQEFVVNSWKRIYINENGNTFLFDINNHINTPANNKDTKINELYDKCIKAELGVVMDVDL